MQVPLLPLVEGTPLPEAYARISFSEAHTFHCDLLLRHPEGYHPGTRASIQMGQPIGAATYILARREMESLHASASAVLFRDADLLITPTSPGVASPLCSSPDLIFLRNTAHLSTQHRTVEFLWSALREHSLRLQREWLAHWPATYREAGC